MNEHECKLVSDALDSINRWADRATESILELKDDAARLDKIYMAQFRVQQIRERVAFLRGLLGIDD